ncbi:peptide-methionine (S)-S-oxide reductase MsrA [Candidatus Wolfebacteria bacterium]|nr:peptide-methionine (S)-S-oxide reductase MsrA [Candidatus Wolfebacteria bacterium]
MVKIETATFAAGCFWGVEEFFRTKPGMIKTEVGYTGGSVSAPTYEMVCSGQTGHAEAVQITYDPEKRSYGDLLTLFWENHDPTTPNRQGPDVGAQYRSVIFYHTSEQEQLARASKNALEESGALKTPIVTEIVPATTFYPAEEYHQRYLARRGQKTC